MDKKENKSLFAYSAGTTLFYNEGDQILFSTDALGFGPQQKGNAAPGVGLAPNEQESLDWASWGDNDDYPIYLQKYLSKLGVVSSALDTVSDIRYGQGIHWFSDEFTADGKRISKMVQVADWARLKREEDLEETIALVLEQLGIYAISFPLITMNADWKLNPERSIIKTVSCLDTYFVRYKKKDDKGFTSHIGYSSLFGEIMPKKEQIQWIPIFDKENPKKHPQYVLPLMHHSSGKIYYPEANWQAVLRAGWGDTLVSVPTLINSIYKNIMLVKYVVRIPIGYFKLKFGDWGDLTEPEKQKIFKKEQDSINKTLTADINAGKTIISITETDNNGNAVGGIIVEPIKSFLDSAKELPNNTFGNQEFSFAAGLDPTLMGSGQKGTSNLSGSGSDKRIASNFKQGTMARRRLQEFKLARHIALQNGYYSQDPFMYPDTIDMDVSQTLDVNPTGKQATK